MENTRVEDKYILQSVENALSIVDLLCLHDKLSAAEVARLMNMGKSSVFRLLSTLLHKGFITKDANSKYQLSYKFAHIGRIVTERSTFVEQIHPYLTELTSLSGETSHLVVWHSDTEIIFIDKVVGNYSIRMDSMVGLTRPAHLTGTGKILLAYSNEKQVHNYLDRASFEKKTIHTIASKSALEEELKKIRELGYACDNEEAEAGLTCFAAPIMQAGNAIAAISMSGPTSRMLENKERLIMLVTTIAKNISDTF